MNKKQIKTILNLLLTIFLCFGSTLNVFAAQTSKEQLFYVSGEKIEVELFNEKSFLSLKDTSNLTISENNLGYLQNITTNSRMSEKIYNVNYSFENGSRIELISLYGETDGSLAIYNSSNNLIAIVNPMVFKDANGTIVPCTTEIQGNTVIYTINDYTPETVYPLNANAQIYASATEFSTWFLSGYWTTRSDGISLALIPVSGWAGPDATMGEISWSWNTVKSRFSSSSNWSNADGMYEQYYCHVLGAGRVSDGIWNLEPWRPKAGITDTLLAGCNPE